ncbi:MAG: biotin--[acetyl-CoA-carboxylase] ligase [Bacteroidota bacterium]
MKELMFSLSKFQAELKTAYIGKPIYIFEALDSTNSYLKSLTVSGANTGTCVLAEYQWAGRGRHHRAWISSPYLNLTFSILVPNQKTLQQPGALSLIISAAIAVGVETYVGLPVETRWPNDLLLNGRKFAGILLENVPNDPTKIVAGIGINVNQTDFPPDILLRATSLRLMTGREIPREPLLAHLLKNVEGALALEVNDALQAWERRFLLTGKTVKLDLGNEQIVGTVEGVGKDGELLLRDGMGVIRHFYAGEIYQVLQ